MATLFQELKRRKVFRVAAVYAVVAWVLIQVADVVLPTFEAPAWVNQTIIFLFILGFIPTLIAAWAFEITPEGIKPGFAEQVVSSPTNNNDRRLIYATFVLVLVVAGFQISDRFLLNSETQTGATSTAVSTSNLSRRFSIDIGSTIPFGGGLTNAEIALSADGRKLAYRVFRTTEGTEYLYLKNLDQLGELELYSGTANTPFFSADGEWIGYTQVDGRGLYKVSIQGGIPQLIAENTRAATGGFWSSDDTVFFTGSDLNIMKVNSNGGVPEPLNTDTNRIDYAHSWPYLLPGGDALIFTAASRDSISNGNIDLLVQSTGETRTIIQNGYNARYVPTGHIVFIRSAALWAVPFDAHRLQVIGPERPMIEGIQTNIQRGAALYAFSDDGLLVYLPGGETLGNLVETSLVWVDRQGNEETLPHVRNFRRWSVSPDGQRVAVAIGGGGANQDIWIYDLIRNTLSRLTFDESRDRRPVWTPDGEQIVFSSDRDGGGLWSRAADGTGQAQRLIAENNIMSGRGATPYSFTPDGETLLYFYESSIYMFTPDAEVPTRPLIQTEFNSRRADLSPDGRWLAYSSDETGRFEVYVRPFPNVDGGKWQISSAGGDNPRWSPSGLELIFVKSVDTGGENSIWVTQRETVDTPNFDTPTRAFESSDAVVSREGTFDFSADGSRLLLQRKTEEILETQVTQLVAVENWFEELKRLAPPNPQ